jgi:hypothetical protein
METTTWTEDTMSQMTVRVTFSLQGGAYTVSASTLFDPNAGLAAAATATATGATP